MSALALASDRPACTLDVVLDASATSQVVEGMGTSVHAGSWGAGALAPALDLLIDRNGVSLVRVVHEPMDWVESESLVPALHALDPDALRRMYESPGMRDLWDTIAYLNRKGLRGGRVVLSLMGWTPEWMGGSGRFGAPSRIRPGLEPAFATMVASLVYYARKVRSLDLALVAPLNEPDLVDGKEGPNVDPAQYATIFEALGRELERMGLRDVRLVGPETVGVEPAYVRSIVRSAAASARVDHLAFHVYGKAAAPGAAPGGRSWWVTETAQWCATCDRAGAPAGGEWAFARDTADVVLGSLENGVSAVLVWEGVDAFYRHHASRSTWGLLHHDPATHAYAPRKRFYASAQVNRFIRPGARRIEIAAAARGRGPVVAVLDPASGGIAVVGHNAAAHPVTFRFRLEKLATSPAAFALYETSASLDLERRAADVPVVGGSFAVTIPADTLFSLTSVAGREPGSTSASP